MQRIAVLTSGGECSESLAELLKQAGVTLDGPISKEIRLVPGEQQTRILNPCVDGYVDNTFTV